MGWHLGYVLNPNGGPPQWVRLSEWLGLAGAGAWSFTFSRLAAACAKRNADALADFIRSNFERECFILFPGIAILVAISCALLRLDALRCLRVACRTAFLTLRQASHTGLAVVGLRRHTPLRQGRRSQLDRC